MTLRTLAALLTAWALAACGSTEKDRLDGEFADAERVLATDDIVEPDPELAGQPIVVPPPFENEEWAQTVGEADHSPIHVALPDALTRLWRSSAVSRKARGAPVTAPPVVGPERLYFIDAVAEVRALDAKTGELVWRNALTPDVRDPKAARFNIFARIDPAELGFGGGAALADGKLFVTSGFGFVAALDAATGELLWRTEAPGPMRNPPAAAQGQVIAVSISNEVISLDQETGEEVWSYQSFEESARVLASATPAVDGESTIVPFSSGEVVSLGTLSGRIQWQAVVARTSRLDALSTLGDIAGSPVVDRGAVFTVSRSGQMAGIDLRTGQVAWERPVGGSHTPWIAGETVYVVSNRGELVAVNRQDGRIRWNVSLPAYENEKKRKKRIIWAGPVLAGGQLYLTGTSKQLIAVSPQTGEITQTYKLRGRVNQPPVVAGGVLYTIDDRGMVEAFGAPAAR